MNDDSVHSLGSRKATVPAGVSFKQWTKILDVGVDANGLPIPGTSMTTDDPPQISRVDLIVSSGTNRAPVEARTDELGQGLAASSEEFEFAGSNPLQVARCQNEATGVRKASLYDRANTNIMAPSNTSQDDVVSGIEDLEPPLVIEVKRHTSCGESDISNDIADPLPRICANNPNAQADREVIVAKDSFADLEGIANLAPLGYCRRPSLFRRFSIEDVPQTVELADRSYETGATTTAKEQEVDSVRLEEGKEQYMLSLGRGTYNTVLRDWLMHVLEKDDQHDTKARTELMYSGERVRSSCLF